MVALQILRTSMGARVLADYIALMCARVRLSSDFSEIKIKLKFPTVTRLWNWLPSIQSTHRFTTT